MPATLSINLNKVALVRNTRAQGTPSVVRAASLCLQAGVAGLTVHPRPDQRHIRAEDVYALHALIAQWNAQTREGDGADAEFNIEGNPFHNLMDFVRRCRPHQATFVPDAHGQLTSDHGWSADALSAQQTRQLRACIEEAQALGVRVSLFMDPLPHLMRFASDLGANRVELYTEEYARAHERGEHAQAIKAYVQAMQAALDAGLQVNAGHDLNIANLGFFLTSCNQITEVSIGHAFIADALEMGYTAAVQAYLGAIALGHGMAQG